MTFFNMKEKVVWKSKNEHIIIIMKRKSFYENDDMIYVVYREKRNYKRFNSYRFYDLKWVIEGIKYNMENHLTIEEIKQICLNNCGCCIELSDGTIQCLNGMGCYRDFYETAELD